MLRSEAPLVLAARALCWSWKPLDQVFPLPPEDAMSLAPFRCPRGTSPKGLWIRSASCQSGVPSDCRLLTSEVIFVGLAEGPLPLGLDEESLTCDESYLA